MCESGDDIEVVHQKEQPKLHGILKQRSRTTSESSDEVFSVNGSYSRENSVGQESPISESDEILESEEGRKKSVSFSEHIDKTTYKAGASVSTLHSTLRNKRKRIRKREQKKETKIERRRRRSSGSMSSDAEDTSSLPDETGSTSEEVGSEGDFEGKDVNTDANAENVPEVDQVGNVKSEEKKGSNKRTSKRKNKINNTGVKEDESAKYAHEPLETSEKDRERSEKSEEASQDVIVNGAKQEGISANHSGDDDTSGKKPVVKIMNDEEDDSDDDEGGNEEITGPGDPRDLEGRTNDKSVDAPETILSWKDKEEGLDGMDHTTQCAFSFANLLMFDLDDD